MAALTPFEPQWRMLAGTTAPRPRRVTPAQNAAFRRGDLVVQATTGTLASPAPTGSMAALNGPSVSVITLGQSASSGAPALTYFGVVTYAATSNESLISQPFIFNTTIGNVPTVSVSATGAPAAATGFNTYLSIVPGEWFKQNSTITALGGTLTGAYPLTNSVGGNRAAVAVSTGILGLAIVDSDAYFFAGVGGSQAVGKRAIFGASQSMQPGWPNDTLQVPVADLANGLVEMNLIQPWNDGLLYTAVGFNIDSGTGFFVADTTQTAAATIYSKPFGPMMGAAGDTYARVQLKLNSAALV